MPTATPAAATAAALAAGSLGLTVDGGAGDDVEIQRVAAGRAERQAGRDWLAAHARVDGDRTVLDLGSRAVVRPVAQLSQF